ncbi:MAG: type I-B CRISPR-associated protein Cas8b/Csh1 [Halanaeroarchaeum sp.]
MLTPEEFRDEYDDAELASELPDSPVSSLRRIQYLYGKLYTLGTLGGGEYAPYLTPDAANDLIDTDDSLIVVRIDLSGDEPKLADDELGPVWVTRYTDDLIPQVAHCKYPAARGIDHSVTHQAGRNSDPEKLSRYAAERLTKWASDSVVQDTASEFEDGWIIEGLAELGNREGVSEEVQRAVEQALGGESTTALLTVQVKTDDGEYRWPGEIDVFLEALRTRKLSKLTTKNKATDSSGTALDLVTEETTRTVGTAEDPQNYFLGKQLEKFPGLDIEEAWRSHPIAEDTAITVMNAQEFVDACTYSTFGARVYYLPYFRGVPTPETARDLYQILYRSVTDDKGMTTVERAYREWHDNDAIDRELRFFVSAVMAHQMSRYDVFGETMTGRLLYPVALAREHNRIVDETSAFRSDGDRTAPMPTHDSWRLLAGDDRRLASVSNGTYFLQTFAEREDTDASADDPRIRALVAVLGGDSIAVETLLEAYVDRIVSEETDQDHGFPSFRVASQFAQLSALATEDLDLLTTTDPGKESITKEPTYTEFTTMTAERILADGGNAAAEKLATFIDETPALSPDSDHPVTAQRRGAFLLGVLIGEVGGYQNYSENRSTTMIDQYPVQSITQNRIKKVTQEAIEKTITYTRQRERTISLFEHVVENLRSTIVRPDPEDWEIGTDDLRFYYALGVTYGMNDHPDWDNLDSQEESA